MEIKSLKSEVRSLDDKVTLLENEITFLKNHNDLSEQRCDDLEQYGWRECLRVTGFALPKSETTDECKKKIIDYFSSLEVEVNDCDIDRAHRIGKKKSNDGVVTQQIIVKFKSFTKRTQIYRARSRSG